MPSHFGLMYYIIWTASLICVTNGAPIEEINMLDKFITDFAKCQVLDFVALPLYKSGDSESGTNMDSEGNYDMSVPLETCSTTPKKDNTAVPLCNEAFEIIRNLSTCGDYMKVASSFKKISIEAQLDNVCEDFSANQAILTRNETYVAFKYADKAICPLVCQGKVLKACAFLLWGYKVQAKINDALASSTTPNKDEEVVPNAEPESQNENHDAIGGGNPAIVPQQNKPEDSVLDHVKHGEHGISRSLTDTETSHTHSLLPVDKNEPLQLKQNEPEPVKNFLKVSDMSKEKLSESDMPKEKLNESDMPKESESNMPKEKLSESDMPKEKLSESDMPKEKLGESDILKAESKGEVKPKNKPEDLVPPKTQLTSEHRSVGKASINSTTVTGKFTTIPLSGTPENDNGQHVNDGPGEKDISSVKATGSSTTIGATHKSTLVNAEGKLPSGKTDEETDNNKLNGAAVVQESKGKGTSPSGSSVPEGDDIDKPFLDTPKIPAKDQEEVQQDISDKDSPKNEENNDPSPGTKNKSKPDSTVNDALEKKNSPENSAHEKTDVTAGKTTNLKPVDSVSEADDVMGVKSQKAEDDDDIGDPGEQFGFGSSDDNYSDRNGDDNDNSIQPVDMNETLLPDGSNSEHEVSAASGAQKSGPQANIDANKTPVKPFDKINVGFPEQEDTHFFFYFVTIVIFAIGGYVLFHNKQKIFALIIEGRHERRRRSGASYRKLETK